MLLKHIHKFICLFFVLLFILSNAIAQENTTPEKVKFYSFEDLLIDGKIKKPQILYTDAREKARFEKLLKLKKDFMPKLKESAKDHVLR